MKIYLFGIIYGLVAIIVIETVAWAVEHRWKDEWIQANVMQLQTLCDEREQMIQLNNLAISHLVMLNTNKAVVIDLLEQVCTQQQEALEELQKQLDEVNKHFTII